MNTDFDFSNIGKRLPYSVPDNFFDDLEREITSRALTAQTEEKKRRRPLMRAVIAAAATAAATIALLLAVTRGNSVGQPAADDFAAVEQAFAQLSGEDQAYIMQTYQNDIFLNEQQ